MIKIYRANNISSGMDIENIDLCYNRTKLVKVSDVQEIQFQVQKWCIEYFDMSTKEIIKLNKLLKIKELKGD